MNPFKGMTKEELLHEAERYKHLCECFQKIDKTKSERIRDLEAQLAARNQAAEAMGVLEEMLRDEQGDMRQLDIYYHPNAGYSVILTHANREELADGYSDDLIEAVLKAGGEGQ